MNNKKFKILLAVDVVLVIGLFALMMVLKSGYQETSKKALDSQIGSYKENADALLLDMWRSVDQMGMAWQLVFKTLESNQTEAAFDANVKAIEENKEARERQRSHMLTAAGVPEELQTAIGEKAGLAEKFLVKNEGGVKEIACGKDCSISFTFEKGKLTGKNYDALKSYKIADHFKQEAPAPFRFE